MKLIDKLKEFDKKLGDKLDLNKRFPGYFNKWVFRLAFVLIAVMIIDAFIAYGVSGQTYLSCNDPAGCLNPLYVCQREDYKQVNGEHIVPNDCFIEVTPAIKKSCKVIDCTKKYLSYGDSYGEKPPAYLDGMFILIVLAFVANHLLYVKKYDRWIYRRPEKWEK